MGLTSCNAATRRELAPLFTVPAMVVVLRWDASLNTKQRMAVWAEGVAMTEYKVRSIETNGTADIERMWNELAQDGWRLVSTAAVDGGGTAARVWLFLEREAKIPSEPADDVARMAANFAQASAATR
jgi:hypothetical protein